jgi:hypothetical protein
LQSSLRGAHGPLAWLARWPQTPFTDDQQRHSNRGD